MASELMSSSASLLPRCRLDPICDVGQFDQHNPFSPAERARIDSDQTGEQYNQSAATTRAAQQVARAAEHVAIERRSIGGTVGAFPELRWAG
jgi:hypothetical protein